MRFPPRLLLKLCASLLLAACGTQDTPPAPKPPPAEDAPSRVERGFLTLRPPTKPDQRPAEPPQPLIPRLVILYSGDPLPESWLQEWNSTRKLTIEQRLLTAADASLPPDTSLLILPPHRLGPLVSQRPLLPLARHLEAAPASPLFLHHPYDPDQQASLPFRWSPYVLYRRRESPKAAFPPLTITWQPDEGILWPEPPAPTQAFWCKSQGSSANAPTNEQTASSWAKIESTLLPVLLSPSAIWTAFIEGTTSRCWLPAAYRCRLPAEKRQNGTIDWVIPAFGTLIHLDLLAIPADAPQAAAAAELAAFLTAPECQSRLAPETGWLPVNQPLGKETLPSPCPLPAGDWLDKSEIPQPPAPFSIASPPVPPSDSQSASTDPQQVPEAPITPAFSPSPHKSEPVDAN